MPRPNDRLARIRSLRASAQSLNRKDVHAEFVRSKAPTKSPNPTSLARKRAQAQDLLDKAAAESEGKDFPRIKSLDYSVQDVHLWEDKQAERQSRMDTGFSDFTQIAAKKHSKLVADLKPDLSKYRSLKSATLATSDASAAPSSSSDASSSSLVLDSNAFYRSAHSLAYADPASKPSQVALDRLATSIKLQDQRRSSFSRRRTFDPNEDVSYINERNAHFNRKIARAYDKHTAEIKANFERGTAL